MINELNENARLFITLRRRCRSGTSSLDLLVSFTLLVTVISVSSPLIVRHGRLLKSHRDYRIALDELSNQLDRITALPADDLPNAIRQISPSTFLTERLPGAKLAGDLQPTEFGPRVTLTLSWNEPDRTSAPVSLAGWVAASAPQPDSESAEANSP